ncbi:hypothetical protein PTKIN_Ptkin18bG0088700 [Pterospermum kingtungense]
MALQSRGIQVPDSCVMCSSHIENSWHLFYSCPFAQDCLLQANILNFVDECAELAEGFSELVFNVLDRGSEVEIAKFVVLMAGVWSSRNTKLWESEVVSAASTVYIALEGWSDWSQAKLFKSGVGSRLGPSYDCLTWHCPPSGFLKCNVDAAIGHNSSMAGIGLVLRGVEGEFIGGKCCLVKVLWRLKKLRQLDNSEFGVIVGCCKDLLSLEQNYSVCFVKRQANVVAHVLAREARFQACSRFFVDVPGCVRTYLLLMCSLSHD